MTLFKATSWNRKRRDTENNENVFGNVILKDMSVHMLHVELCFGQFCLKVSHVPVPCCF